MRFDITEIIYYLFLGVITCRKMEKTIQQILLR